MTVTVPAQIINACNTLFGPEVEVTMDFLDYLQPSGVKAAFCKKALETHPDRAILLGKDEAVMLQNFKDVNTAYENLYSIVCDQNKLFVKSAKNSGKTERKPYKHNNKSENNRNISDTVYSGIMPDYKLPLGRFMYYSGIISWQTLIKSILWQKKSYSLIGQLAIKWNMLSSAEIKWILSEKIFPEKFGEFALRNGYLTGFQIAALLGKQNSCKRPIGEYFIKEKIFRSHEIENIVKNQKMHNNNIRI